MLEVSDTNFSLILSMLMCCPTDKVDISNFQWWLLIFNYETPCRSKDRPPPIRQVIQVEPLLLRWSPTAIFAKSDTVD